MLFDPNRVNYILRYYLPHWALQQRLGEVIDYCHATGTRHVMFMCAPQHMTWNQIPVELAERERDGFIEAAEQLRAHGIGFGLNMGVTFGHGKCKWDHRRQFPQLQYWITDFDGTEHYNMPCPLDPHLRKHVLQIYRIYAQCSPDYIYVDDDLRYTFTHDERRWGCACPLHLARLADTLGKSFTAGELQSALYNEGEVRKVWIELLGQTLVEWARDLAAAVHQVNADIAMGMMVPCVHLLPLFGHNLTNIVDALTDGVKPIVRPCIGAYSDWNRREVAAGACYMELTAHVLADRGIEFTPELETTPFTRLSKSMTVLRFQIAQGVLNGMANPAITSAGYVGDHVDVEPAYRTFLPAQKPFFEALLRARPERGTRRGVQFIFEFDSAKLATGRVHRPTELAWPMYFQARLFAALGLCYTFDESPVKLLAGDSVRALPRQRIEQILSEGVILDAAAARALCRMGHADLIGVTVGEPMTDWMSEQYLDEQFTGPYVDTYTPIHGDDPILQLKVRHGARILSRILDPSSRELGPGVVLYENSMGGKVAVMAFVFTVGEGDVRHLLCYQKRYLLRNVIRWMNAAVLPVFVENPTDFLVQAWDDGAVLTACLTNLSFDRCRQLAVAFSHAKHLPAENATYVDDDGAIRSLDVIDVNAGRLDNQHWTIRHESHAFEPLFIRIRYAV